MGIYFWKLYFLSLGRYNRDMKNYFNIILFSLVLLILFPFLALPELWENLYVSLLAFVAGSGTLLLRHKTSLRKEVDDETSLQEYAKKLQERFKDQVGDSIKPGQNNTSRVSDISPIEDND